MVRAVGVMQGWDQAHQQAAEGKAKQEVAAAGLAEMCQRVQDLGERFYPNEATSLFTPYHSANRGLTYGLGATLYHCSGLLGIYGLLPLVHKHDDRPCTRSLNLQIHAALPWEALRKLSADMT